MEERKKSLPIFVISLQRSEERRQSIQKQFDDLSLSFTFIDAIDGKYLTQEEIETFACAEEIKKQSAWLNPYAIACALSHRKVYQKILAEKHPHALILEDDMLLSEKSITLLPKLVQQMEADEVCMLYYRAFHTMNLALSDKRILTKEYQLLSPIDEESIPLTAGAYLVTYQAVERLNKILLPIRYSADSWGEFYKDGGLHRISCVYPRPLKDANFKSTIDYFTQDQFKWAKYFSLWVDRYHIPLLFSLFKWKRIYREWQMSQIKLVEGASLFMKKSI